jgi:hypothetical protein
MVVFDEHGGTYDHVPLPTANPPDPAGPAGQMAAPREPEDWPDVSPQPVPDFDGSLIPLDAPLSPMARWLVGGSVELARGLDRSVPEIPNLDDLTGAEGLAIVHESVGHLFPGLRRAG